MKIEMDKFIVKSFILIFWWVIFSFVKWEINPAAWGEGYRYVMVCFVLFSLIVSVADDYLEKIK